MGGVYLEPVFLENVLMDMLTLYIAGRLCGRRGRFGRYMAASCLGGAYAAMTLLPFCSILNSLPAKIVLSLGMTAIAWRIYGWLAFVKGWASMVGVTAVGGGGALAAAAILDSTSPFSGTVRLSSDALLLTLLGAASITLFSATALRRRGKAPDRYPIRVWQRGRKFEFDALLDTGNLLREPLSGVPVVILEKGLGRKIMSLAGRTVEIPFHTAGGQSSVRAMPAERAEILCKGKWKNMGDIYLACCEGTLSGGVEALLPPAAMEQ